MKLYIAGPMAGLPEFNYPAFNHAENVLVNRGFGTVNPAALDMETLDHSGDMETGGGVTTLARAGFLKRDFRYLAECDGIILLDGWEESTGANCELAAAHMMGLDIFVFTLDGIEIPTPWLIPRMEIVSAHMSKVAARKTRLNRENLGYDDLGRMRLTFSGAEGISDE